MTLPSWRDWLFSAKTFAAAMLAVYLGLAMSLPRPYWAMATVYICSQPLSGATRSKAVYRLAGTLVGAAVAVVLIPNLVDAPELLALALALWTAVCLYVSLLDRTPRSYLFMLAGYTAALIGFPSVLQPEAIFDTALARTEEISLGIVCASLVSSLAFPRSVGSAIAARLNGWLTDAGRASLDALSGRPADARSRADLIRLAADAAEIDILSTHLAYENSTERDAAHWVRLLRVRMLTALPVLSSIADRMRALTAGGAALGAPLDRIVRDLRAWIGTGAIVSTAEADRLRAAIAEADPPLHAGSSWRDILAASLLIRLRELVDIRRDCRALQRHIGRGGGPLPEPLAFRPEEGIETIRHRDHALALLSGAGVAIAVLVCCGLWIATGWPDGASAPMMAAVACSFFASRDDPAPAIVEFARWTGVAVVIMGVYQFAVFPLVHDFEILALVLAPAFLVFGLLIAHPRTAGIGLALAANGATVVAIQSTYGADFTSYANSSLALLIGMTLAAVVTRLVRSVGAEWSIRRLLRATAATLSGAAAGYGAQDRARLAGLTLDRLALLAPRMAALAPGHDLIGRDLLTDLRLGLNILDLRRARRELPEAARAAVESLLDALARFFRKGRNAADRDLLPRIDATLATVLAGQEQAGKRDAVLGVVGVRQALFPDAHPYEPGRPGEPITTREAA